MTDHEISIGTDRDGNNPVEDDHKGSVEGDEGTEILEVPNSDRETEQDDSDETNIG